MTSAWAPGRVNLIGDHTDYNQGKALPMAIQLGTAIDLTPTEGDSLVCVSDRFFELASIPIGVPARPEVICSLSPEWARNVAAVLSLAPPRTGGIVRITSTVPTGAGLSSSTALEVALARAFDIEGDPLSIARLCRRAEHLTGVPSGLLDPLACAGAREGNALLIDFATLSTSDIPLPAGVDVVVVDSLERRSLREGGYAFRVHECEEAARIVGPLGRAGQADLTQLHDPDLRRRARHVVAECARVDHMAASLRSGDIAGAGLLMSESHWSLSRDFEVSTSGIDSLVQTLMRLDGVLGARLTGAGFGGCIVALALPGAVDLDATGLTGWVVRPSAGSGHLEAAGDCPSPHQENTS